MRLSDRPLDAALWSAKRKQCETNNNNLSKDLRDNNLFLTMVDGVLHEHTFSAKVRTVFLIS